jgi:hypothetical protein
MLLFLNYMCAAVTAYREARRNEGGACISLCDDNDVPRITICIGLERQAWSLQQIMQMIQESLSSEGVAK